VCRAAVVAFLLGGVAIVFLQEFPLFVAPFLFPFSWPHPAAHRHFLEFFFRHRIVSLFFSDR